MTNAEHTQTRELLHDTLNLYGNNLAERRKADNDAARLNHNRRKEKTITSTRRYTGKPCIQELLDAVHKATNM